MAEYNSIDHGFHETTNTYPNLNAVPLSDQQHFTLKKMKLMIAPEIKERELMNKRLSKYIASFDYFDKSIVVLSIVTGSISIASFATVMGAAVGILSAILVLHF